VECRPWATGCLLWSCRRWGKEWEAVRVLMPSLPLAAPTARHLCSTGSASGQATDSSRPEKMGLVSCHPPCHQQSSFSKTSGRRPCRVRPWSLRQGKHFVGTGGQAWPCVPLHGNRVNVQSAWRVQVNAECDALANTLSFFIKTCFSE